MLGPGERAEATARAIKATKMLAQLRLDLAAIAVDGCDPDAAHLCTIVNTLSLSQMHALAVRAGINTPSFETLDMVRALAMAMVEVEERYSDIPAARSYLDGIVNDGL